MAAATTRTLLGSPVSLLSGASPVSLVGTWVHSPSDDRGQAGVQVACPLREVRLGAAEITAINSDVRHAVSVLPALQEPLELPPLSDQRYLVFELKDAKAPPASAARCRVLPHAHPAWVSSSERAWVPPHTYTPTDRLSEGPHIHPRLARIR